MAKKTSKHRFLGNKALLIRDATASCARDPDSETLRLYLRGLCDGLHGMEDREVSRAIHVARQVIISTQEA